MSSATHDLAISILAKKPKTPGVAAPEADESEGPEGLDQCAQEMLDAIKSDDAAAFAKALKAAFDVLESAPHDEADHEEG